MTKKRLNTKDVVMKRTAILAPILSLNPSKEQYQLELRQKIKENDVVTRKIMNGTSLNRIIQS